MKAGGSAQVINDEAAAWLARVDARPLVGEARAEFSEWLARDDRHRGAFVRALAIWHAASRNEPIDAEICYLLHPAPADAVAGTVLTPTDEDEPVGAPAAAFSRRRALWAGAALAASLVPVALLFGLGPAADTRRIDTALGELTRVPLQDGSMVVVNTASRLEVQQSAALRKVRIDEGEAWFKVAKDASRPFVVSAGEIRVRALGTAFSVRRRDDGADVQVTEGIVEVWSEAQTGPRAKVSAGTRAFVNERTGTQGVVKDQAAIERELSWREGVLNFDGNTLRDAAEEFNRYNVTKLQIDPALAEEQVVGRFSTTEPDTFARVISMAFDAKMEKGAGWIHIQKN